MRPFNQVGRVNGIGDCPLGLFALLLAISVIVLLTPVSVARARSLSDYYILENIANPPSEAERLARLRRLGLWFADGPVAAEGKMLTGSGFDYRFLVSLRLDGTMEEAWNLVEKVEAYEEWVTVEENGGIAEFSGVRGKKDRTGFTIFIHFGGIFQLWNGYPFHLSLLRSEEKRRSLFITFASDESMLRSLEMEARFEEAASAEQVVVHCSVALNLDWKNLFVSRRFVKREFIPLATALLDSLRRAIGGGA
jgi:hypothetical protein